MSANVLFTWSVKMRILNLIPRPILRNYSRRKSVTETIRELSGKDFQRKKLLWSQLFPSKIPVPSVALKFVVANDSQTVIGQDIVNLLSILLRLPNEQKYGKELDDELFYNNLFRMIELNIHNCKFSEIIEILNCLLELDCSTSSKIVEFVLEHIDSIKSSILLKDYNRLTPILEQISLKSETAKIQNYLNKSFLKKTLSESNENDLDSLVDYFEYACLHSKDNTPVHVILNKINCSIDFKNESIFSAIKLLKLLNTVRIVDHIEERKVLYKMQDLLLNNVNQMSIEDIFLVLHKMSEFISSGSDELYNPIFWDRCAQKIISNNVNLQLGRKFLLYFMKVKHINKELLSYLYATCYDTKIRHHQISSELSTLLTLMEASVLFKFKPLFWDLIHGFFRIDLLFKRDNHTLLTLAFYWAYFNHYNKSILKKLFETETDLVQRSDSRYLLKLWQKLKTSPDYNGPLLAQNKFEMIQKCMEKTKSSYPLLPFLKQGLGGSAYVKTKLTSKLYHEIDHIVVYRNREYPVAINEYDDDDICNKDIEYLENLKNPPNSNVIIVNCCPASWYSRNTGELLGLYASQFETLEAMSYPVVTISEKDWLQLSKEARIPYLMNKLKLKLNSIVDSSEISSIRL